MAEQKYPSRPSVPTPGKTLSRSLQPWRVPLRQAFEALTQEVRVEHQRSGVNGRTLFLDSLKSNNGTVRPDGLAELTSSALLSAWLVARANGVPCSNIAESEAWFFEDSPHLLSPRLPIAVVNEISVLFGAFPTGEDLRDLLPYLFEAFEGDGFAAIRDRGPVWRKKRETGVFYTPSDVADYITSRTIGHFQGLPVPTCLDPACGTGVFLRSALCYLRTGWGIDSRSVCRSLYGIDISQRAVHSAAFTLLAECLNADDLGDQSPFNLWQQIRQNFAVIDSTTIGTIRTPDLFGEGSSLTEMFPAMTSSFDVVVGNPPYSSLPSDGKHALRRQNYLSAGNGRSGQIYPLFVEMMWRLTNSTYSSAGMVIPLSISYRGGDQLRALRKQIEQEKGSWHLQFFDRTPDSLFGDDTKTRNCIMFMFRDSLHDHELFTTELQRWSSRGRHNMFDSIHEVRLVDQPIIDLVPKIGSDLEASCYRSLRSRKDRMDIHWLPDPRVRPLESRSVSIFHYSTAYNWLPVLRSFSPDLDDSSKPVVPNSLRAIQCTCEETASFSFGILSTRLVYWLWRVEQDGFHLARSFLASVPIQADVFDRATFTRICELGDLAWGLMLQAPVVSRNAGRLTLNYRPQGAAPVIDELDAIVVAGLGLPPGFAGYLKDYQCRLVDAGRTSLERN